MIFRSHQILVRLNMHTLTLQILHTLVEYFLPAITIHPQNHSIMADGDDYSSSSSSSLETPRKIDFENDDEGGSK